MTAIELKELIATSVNPEWFNQKVDKINYHYLDYIPEFTSVSALFEYALDQIEGWEKLGELLPDNLKDCKTQYAALKAEIENFVLNQINAESEALTGYWAGQIFPQIDKVRYSFPFDGVETIFLIKVYNNQPDFYEGAYQFTVGHFTKNIGVNKNHFIGAILAYEASSKGKSIIAERSIYEENSLEILKNNFQKYIGESEQHLVNKLKDTNTKYNEFVQGIGEYRTNKEKEVSDWLNTSQNNFKTFDEGANTKIKELEELYKQKLSLSAPAEYWNKRANMLKKEGWLALKWLVVLVLFACITLYFLLWQTPEGMLTSFFSNDKTLAIKWSIVFVTFISFLAFGIRALSKVMFSSFHLSRDAEEREHLTFVYLSLSKDTSMEKEDRLLIMQSLFSRADSGLLKDDSSPTMPGIIEKFTQK